MDSDIHRRVSRDRTNVIPMMIMIPHELNSLMTGIQKILSIAHARLYNVSNIVDDIEAHDLLLILLNLFAGHVEY